MKITRILSRIIAALLIIITVLSDPAFVSAAPGKKEKSSSGETYVSEVKLFYGQNADYARAECEKEGFIFCQENLQRRSKELKLKVYLGYKTTTNKDEAITDLGLFDMKNSHYEILDMKKFAASHETELADLAEKIMSLVYNFREQYEAGNPNALAAYDSLNIICMDEDRREDLLGDYMLSGADAEFFTDYLKKGSNQILSSIEGYLCGAAAEAGEDNWMERSKANGVVQMYEEATSAQQSEYDLLYQNEAKGFISEIKQLISTYDEAKDLLTQYGESFGYDVPETEEGEIPDYSRISNCRIPEYMDAIMVYQILDGIEYERASEEVVTDADLLHQEDASSENERKNYEASRSVAELFRDIASDDEINSNPAKVYNLIAGMTTAQRVSLQLGGLTLFTRTLENHPDYADERAAILKDREEKMEELDSGSEKISLWQGSTRHLFDKRIAETSASIEAQLAGTAVKESINQIKRDEWDETAYKLSIASICFDCYMLADTLVTLFVGVGISAKLWGWGTAAILGVKTASCAAGAVAGSVGGVLLCGLGAALYVAGVAATLYTIYQIGVALEEWRRGESVYTEIEETPYNKIPDCVKHVVEKGSGESFEVWYDSVKCNLTRSFLDKMHQEFMDDTAQYANINIDLVENPRDCILGFDHYDSLDATKYADITGFQGVRDRWVNLYYTKAPAAGKPLRVARNGSLFYLGHEIEDYEGCRPLKLIGSGMQEDIQSVKVRYSYKTEVSGTPTFLYLITDPEAAAKRISKKREKKKPGEDEEKGKGLYIHGVKLSHSSKMETAKNELKKDNYTEILDVNLTPGDGYTYVGYRLGGVEGAVRDIRASTQMAFSLDFGKGRYVRCGTEDAISSSATPDGMALYSSTSACTGTPIKKITVEKNRLPIGSGAEPVCTFSGGDAVNFKHYFGNNLTQKDIKEKPSTSQSDLKDSYYLYFWPEEEYKAQDENSQAPYISGISYFMSVDKDGKNAKFCSNDEYIRRYAEDHGFELVLKGDSPALMMSSEAADMNTIYVWQTKQGGLITDDTDDITHHLCGNMVQNNTDDLVDIVDDSGIKTTMYMGVSYTYNPYRAITGVSGLLSAYTETSHSLRNGMMTPAGGLQPSTVCIQGNPVAQAGISLGYYNPVNMDSSLYTNSKAQTKSKLPWMSDNNTEVLSRYLFMCGPAAGREPLRRGDIVFSTDANPGGVDGYVPVCDMRTPGDYEHPMNFALETVNMGSRYLYMFIKNDAGRRTGEEAADQNVYKKKKYVASVFVGTGKTVDEAIGDLYAKASSRWGQVAAAFPDISDNPLVTEFDEILTTDPGTEKQWYQYKTQDVSKVKLSYDEMAYGNEAARTRWGSSVTRDDRGNWIYKPIETFERTSYYSFIGVVRTDCASGAKMTVEKTNKQGETVDRQGRVVRDGKVYDAQGKEIGKGTPATEEVEVDPVHGMIKYYAGDKKDTAPSRLKMGGSTEFFLAGGPIRSKEGHYFLYYSANTGTAAVSAPVMGIEFSKEPFTAGYNCCYSCTESDRTDNTMPSYASLRMRDDEFRYIHLKYDLPDMPFIERMYLGIGNSKKEAIRDLLYSTGSSCVSDVNCNYNSYSEKWIAVGYRRTSSSKACIRDVMLFAGENAPDKLMTTAYKKGTDGSEKVTIKYTRVDHNLRAGGSELLSLNSGCDGAGLYLYYTEGDRSKQLYYDEECHKPMMPIRNFAYSYGDTTRLQAGDWFFKTAFKGVHGDVVKTYEDSYKHMKWEYIMGIEEDCLQDDTFDSSSAAPMSLNKGQLPMVGNSKHHHGDMKIMMYADRGGGVEDNEYVIRQEAAVPRVDDSLKSLWNGSAIEDGLYGQLRQGGEVNTNWVA